MMWSPNLCYLEYWAVASTEAEHSAWRASFRKEAARRGCRFEVPRYIQMSNSVPDGEDRNIKRDKKEISACPLQVVSGAAGVAAGAERVLCTGE